MVYMSFFFTVNVRQLAIECIATNFIKYPAFQHLQYTTCLVAFVQRDKLFHIRNYCIDILIMQILNTPSLPC